MAELSQTEKQEIINLHTQILDTVEKNAKQTRELEGKFETTIQAKLDKLNTEIDRRMVDVEKAVFKPIKHANSELAKEANPERKAAYDNFLRKGDKFSTPEHIKLLTEGDATTGGFFVVPEYVQEIIKQVILISPIRQFAKIRTTNSNSVKLPKRTGTFAATWTAEAQAQVEATGLKYGMEDVPNHAMTALQNISFEDLEDGMFDLSAELNMEFAEQFAKAEGAAFVNGTGKGQPEGFMTNSSVAYDPTTSATALTADAFTTCSHNLKTVYARDATWFLNRQTIGQVRLLKDTQNRPLWLPFAQSGIEGPNGPTILGIPYAEIPDMPAVAAGTYPIALADWKRAYVIVDRINIMVRRDDLTQATNGYVRFFARKRVGGQLVLSEAIRKIKVSVS